MEQPHDTAVLRIVDANANRAAEGLRVAEEYARFVLDDAHLTRLCKELRHDLTAALTAIPARDRLAAREVERDVGAAITAGGEAVRNAPAEVAAAALARVQQSLRSLEEYTKLIDDAAAARLESLRYRSYTLAKAMCCTTGALHRLTGARLYVLIDGRDSEHSFEQTARELVGAGVHALQLRDKSLDDRSLLARARLLRAATAQSRTLCIVNDRVDIALLSRADGVHVGQEELPVKEVRTLAGPNFLVGVSTHTLEQARRAVLDGADYIGVGPIFPSHTKAFNEHTGIELARGVATEVRLPAFAIGGIDHANVEQVVAAGLTRIAVGHAIASASRPAEAVGKLLMALGAL